MPDAKPGKQVNLRVGSAPYSALETIAQDERRSVSQAARLLLEEDLRSRIGSGTSADDIPTSEIAKLAATGGSFDWLLDEPDLYDDAYGEPI